MPNFAVATIKADRNLMANLTVDPVQAFEVVALQAKSLLAPFPGVQMIVAPEYFLNTRLGTDTSKPEVMSRSAKHDTYDALKALSARLNNTILVAGTIFYKKGLMNKVGLNVCPVLQNGQIIHKYYKVYDDGSLAANDPDAKYESKNTSPVFACSGITFAVEVCGDTNDDNAAQRNWQGQSNSGAVDVHVIIADGAGMPLTAIQARKYCILTDLQDGRTTVRHSANGQWQPVTQNGVTTFGFNSVEPAAASTSQATGARIWIYDLPV